MALFDRLAQLRWLHAVSSTCVVHDLPYVLFECLRTSDLVMPRTGQKRKTSAASLVMLGKDGKVVWSAP